MRAEIGTVDVTKPAPPAPKKDSAAPGLDPELKTWLAAEVRSWGKAGGSGLNEVAEDATSNNYSGCSSIGSSSSNKKSTRGVGWLKQLQSRAQACTWLKRSKKKDSCGEEKPPEVLHCLF